MSTSALFLDLLIHPEANRTWSPCYSAISSSLTQTPIAGRNAAHTKPGDQTLSRDRTGLLRQFPAGIYKIVHQLQESLAFDAQRSMSAWSQPRIIDVSKAIVQLCLSSPSSLHLRIADTYLGTAENSWKSRVSIVRSPCGFCHEAPGRLVVGAAYVCGLKRPTTRINHRAMW